MSEFRLVIGNYNYSSWSLRAWYFMRSLGLEFEETRILLDQAGTREALRRASPSGRVPVLIHGDVTVWDSLAICTYLGDVVADVDPWPEDIAARAMARSAACEMHSSFPALRAELPMNCRARRRLRPGPAAEADIQRVFEVLTACRRTAEEAGPWLCGTFSVADAMYAPVATRFVTYDVPCPPLVSDWMDTIMASPAMTEWQARAADEVEVIEGEEVGEPR